jgi:hypothetical protein
MRFDEVRQAIIQEWLNLPPESRQTEEQAANFVTQAARRHRFDPDKDPFNLIMRWLAPHVPRKGSSV